MGAYMIEGGGSRTFQKAKTWLYQYPKESHQLLQWITDLSVRYLVEQAKYGAQLLKVFDSWAGELTPQAFEEFCFPYLQQIEVRVKEQLKQLGDQLEFIPPMIVFPKGAHFSLDLIISKTSYEVLAIDWQTDPKYVQDLCARAGRKICLQGNLDPIVMFGSIETIRSHTKSMLEQFKCESVNHIANLGHGVLPTHSPEHVGAFIEAVH